MNLSVLALSISLLLAAVTGLANSKKTWRRPGGRITMGIMLKAIHAHNKRLSTESQNCKKLEVVRCYLLQPGNQQG